MKDFKMPAKVQCTLKEYLAHPAIGSSSLRTLIEQSPAHYLYERENPKKQTPAMALGTAIHQAILEPQKFKESAIIEPPFSGAGSRAAKEQWYLENHGRMILGRDDYETIRGILNSVTEHKLAWKYISKGYAEEGLFWQDHETTIPLKARPDFIRDGHILIDIKSTGDASYSAFMRTIADFGYHIQAALYLDGATEVLKTKFDEFIVVAVEKTPPYAANCFLLDESMISEGRALYMSALKTLQNCIRTGVYPAYPEELHSATLPTWAYKTGVQNE